MGAIFSFAYNNIYTRLPRLLKYRISRSVYKPKIDKKAVVAGCPEFHTGATIGAYSTIQDESFFAQCEIGKYCACAKGVRFLHTQHRVRVFSQLGTLGEAPFRPAETAPWMIEDRIGSMLEQTVPVSQVLLMDVR